MNNFDNRPSGPKNNNLGINPDELAAAESALVDFVNAEPNFWNISPNCLKLQRWLQAEGVPLSRWHVKAFALAYWSCTRPDTDAKFRLEPIPPKETAQERIERLQARDREGYTGGKHASRLEKTAEGRTVSEYEKQCADKNAKAIADADLSNIPTVESLVAEEAPMFSALSVNDAMRLSLQQGKLYARRSSEAAVEIQRRRSDAKVARMKELGKS